MMAEATGVAFTSEGCVWGLEFGGLGLMQPEFTIASGFLLPGHVSDAFDFELQAVEATFWFRCSFIDLRHCITNF